MRIALISSLYEPFGQGGSERSTRELAEGLAARGHQVLVVALVPPGRGGDQPEEIAGVTVVRLESAGVRQIFPGVPRGSWLQRRWHQVAEWHRVPVGRKLARVLEDYQPDVVHTALVSGFGAIVWKVARRYPLVHTIRDYYLVCARTAAFRDGKACESQCASCRFMRIETRRALRDADLVAAVSGYILQRHFDWDSLPGDMRTEVVYDRPVVAAPKRAAAGPASVVGCIGKLGEFKGTFVLLDAMAMIDDPDLRLVIAGPGEPDEVNRVLSAAAQDPRIRYAGVQDVVEFLESVDIVAAPAQLNEPFGRTPYEGALAGKHVIVSRRGGLPEVVQGYPNAHFVDESADPAAWAEAIKRVIGTTPDTATWIGHPDPVERYESLYREVIGARG